MIPPGLPSATRSHTSVAVLAAVFLGLCGASAWANNDPIPGVDIVVKKHPGYPRSLTTTTNKGGKFTFAHLKAGTYVLTVKGSVTPQPGTPEPGPSEPISRPKVTTVKGVRTFTITVALGTSKVPPLTIKVTRDGSKITGVVATAPDLPPPLF